jgi:hypothetical protein
MTLKGCGKLEIDVDGFVATAPAMRRSGRPTAIRPSRMVDHARDHAAQVELGAAVTRRRTGLPDLRHRAVRRAQITRRGYIID